MTMLADPPPASAAAEEIPHTAPMPAAAVAEEIPHDAPLPKMAAEEIPHNAPMPATQLSQLKDAFHQASNVDQYDSHGNALDIGAMAGSGYQIVPLDYDKLHADIPKQNMTPAQEQEAISTLRRTMSSYENARIAHHLETGTAGEYAPASEILQQQAQASQAGKGLIGTGIEAMQRAGMQTTQALTEGPGAETSAALQQAAAAKYPVTTAVGGMVGKVIAPESAPFIAATGGAGAAVDATGVLGKAAVGALAGAAYSGVQDIQQKAEGEQATPLRNLLMGGAGGLAGEVGGQAVHAVTGGLNPVARGVARLAGGAGVAGGVNVGLGEAGARATGTPRTNKDRLGDFLGGVATSLPMGIPGMLGEMTAARDKIQAIDPNNSAIPKLDAEIARQAVMQTTPSGAASAVAETAAPPPPTANVPETSIQENPNAIQEPGAAREVPRDTQSAEVHPGVRGGDTQGSEVAGAGQVQEKRPGATLPQPEEPPHEQQVQGQNAAGSAPSDVNRPLTDEELNAQTEKAIAESRAAPAPEGGVGGTSPAPAAPETGGEDATKVAPPQVQPDENQKPLAEQQGQYTREKFSHDLKAKFGLPPDQSAAVVALTDARADAWAKENGKSPKDYYPTRLAGMTTEGFNKNAESKVASESLRSAAAGVSFQEDGKAIIRALNAPTVASAVHEMGHIFRRDLSPADLKAAEDWAGNDPQFPLKNGNWERFHEERFARGFEAYLREGKAPTAALSRVFEKFKQWMTTIYKSVKGGFGEGHALAVNMSDEMRATFDRMLGKEEGQGGQAQPENAPAPPADKSKGEFDVGDKLPFPGSNPKDKFPVVADVRMTPDGQRQYQVKFSDKTSAQWLPAPKPVPDAALPISGDLNVDPENKSGFGQGSIGAAEDTAALARSGAAKRIQEPNGPPHSSTEAEREAARERAAKPEAPSLLSHAATSIKNLALAPAKWLQSFRSRFQFLTDRYGVVANNLRQKLGELVTAKKTGNYFGDVSADRVFKGLSNEQKSNVVALGLDGRRQLENQKLSNAFADAMVGPSKGAANKLAGPTLHDSVAKALRDALEHPDGFDHYSLAAELAQNLHNLNGMHPNLITKWADLAGKNSLFQPEALAAGERARAARLFKLSDESRSAILADPKVKSAVDVWNKDVQPTITRLRAENGKPLDPNWKSVPLALNFVGNGENLPPFEPFSGIRQHERYENPGVNLEKQTDPKQYLSKIISDHLTEARENAAVKELSKNTQLQAKPDSVYLAETGPNKGRTVGTINGKEVSVERYDVAREADPTKKDPRWIPADLKKQLDSLNAVERPDNTRSIGAFVIGMALKGKAAMHAYGALSRTAQTVAGKVPQLENVIPYAGSRVGTAVRALQDAFSPVGELHQGILDSLGASGDRGFASAHSDKSVAQIIADYKSGKASVGQTAKAAALKIFGIDHDVLFAPKIGAENILRGRILDTFLQSRFGQDYQTTKESVRSGATSPLAAGKALLDRFTPNDHKNAQAMVNDTLGWLDKGTRSQGLNNAQKFFSFIGTEISTIPGDVRRMLTANVDGGAVKAAASKGDLRGAAIRAASGILAGPVGAYLFGNAINLATSGKLMKDNDEGHKLDVHLGGGWYVGLDSAVQRGARLLGLKDWANNQSNTPSSYAGHVAGRAYNEMTSVMHPVFSMLSKGAAALAGAKTEFDPGTGKAYVPSASEALPVPYLTNTVRNAMKGQSLGEGLAKDAATNLAGQTLTKSSPYQQKLAAESPAQAKARELGYHGDGSPMTAEDKAKYERREAAVNAYKSKDSAAFSKIYNDPATTRADQQNIAQRMQSASEFAFKVKKLPMESAMQVWEKMTPAERAADAWPNPKTGQMMSMKEALTAKLIGSKGIAPDKLADYAKRLK